MLPGGPIRRRSEIVRENCPRFRILVMGKRNAGKTTILHKMTDTTDGIVYVHDPQGQPVDPAVIQPSVERGMSNIRNEVTFPTSPGFVFHDSRGIEAGSREEIDTLQQFIAERAAEDNIQKRLHVIWYCLPLDNDRPLSDEEMRFFETGTHDVPVVAIFTKCEWRVAKAFASLRSQGLHIPRAQKEAPDIAMKDIEKIVENRFAATKYRPAGFVRLSKMHEPGSGCTDLMDRTAQVIDGEVLDHLFAAVRQKAIEVSMRAALRVVIWDMQRTHRPISERDVVKVLLFFPRWFVSTVAPSNCYSLDPFEYPEFGSIFSTSQGCQPVECGTPRCEPFENQIKNH
ncbi:hypothetical protein BD779DRAFT_1542881 [Infundibulicybe gibba]|nr:hypothetical protein BD779DRAFT_1567681 [Infundibulicybe gibba]KAF8882387.1 hypothetical protein BD779DRAFT_1542881 [Infundibulicybe gibba]